MKEIINEWRKYLLEQEDYGRSGGTSIEYITKELASKGFAAVNSLNLPNNKYSVVYTKNNPWIVYVYSSDNNFTGYAFISNHGVIGCGSTPEESLKKEGCSQSRLIINNQIHYAYPPYPLDTDINRIFFKNVGYKPQEMKPSFIITTKTSQQVPAEVVDGNPPMINVVNGKANFIFNDKLYAVDLSDIYPTLSGKTSFASVRAADIKKMVPGIDIKDGTILIGFMPNSQVIQAYYINSQGQGITKEINIGG
jgi:hypothetical protein